jgi:hypothetical protein
LGSAHTCALLDDRTVKCWGRNGYGRLGYGDTRDRGDDAGETGDALSAVALGAGRTAVSIVAGSAHTCALLDDRTVKCWGRNGYGRLGYGDTRDRGDGAGEMGDALPALALGAPTALLPSPLQVNAATDCTCLAGYSAEADGVACAACGAGTYKEAAGAGSCTACPAHTSSTAGSTALVDCTCEAGYSAEADGVACAACGAGTYKSATGAGSCTPCEAGTYAPFAGGPPLSARSDSFLCSLHCPQV